MKQTWIAGVVIAGGLGSAMFGQQYPQRVPQQYPPYQGAPDFNGQYRDNGEYSTEPGNGAYDRNPDYNAGDQGVYAPEPPQEPGYAYARPPMPGPGYYWVDGYWNLIGRRYSWVGGYWTRPPYTGGYWVRPRYSGGRFFIGFWGSSHRESDRRSADNHNRNRGRDQAPRQSYRSPAPSRSGFRDGDNRGDRPGNGNSRGRS